jgi:hypothetical protein
MRAVPLSADVGGRTAQQAHGLAPNPLVRDGVVAHGTRLLSRLSHDVEPHGITTHAG